MKKVFKWIINIFICMMILMIVSSIVSNTKSDISSIFGYTPMKVLTGSMEPSIKVGDIVVVRKRPVSDIKIGDVITYKMEGDVYITHRVAQILMEDDDLKFKTKGDANNIEDSDFISEDQLIGRLAFRIPKGGYIVDFIKKPIGFITFFVIPIVILIGTEIKLSVKQW